MRNVHVVLCLLMIGLCSHKSFGQFNQGRWLAGGSFNFSATTQKEKAGSTTTTIAKSTSFGLSPEVGYFVMDNLAVGGTLGISSSKTEYQTFNTTYTGSSVSIGPFVRYYLPMSVFFQGTATFGSGTSKTDSDSFDTETKTGILNWGLGAGYAYFLNDYVAIEPMIGYQNNGTTDKETDEKNISGSVYLAAALTIYLGERK